MTCSVRSCDFRSLRAGDASVLPSNPSRGRLYLLPTDSAACDLQPARVRGALFATATALRDSLSCPRFRSRRQPASCCVSDVRKTMCAKCGFALSRRHDTRAAVAVGCVLRKSQETLLGRHGTHAGDAHSLVSQKRATLPQTCIKPASLWEKSGPSWGAADHHGSHPAHADLVRD